jgi:hypothetical protein
MKYTALKFPIPKRYMSGMPLPSMISISQVERGLKGAASVLVVALKHGLGGEVVHLCPDVALQPAQEAFDLLVWKL